jgi:hypothetical protein
MQKIGDLMHAKDVLSDQVIHVKRGRSNSFGFEPLWNSYFDFYLDGRYFEEPLLELQDVTFHLYLRKNLNDKNPSWKMPSVRQIIKKFRVGQAKVYNMLERLEKAHLLTKESGVRAEGNERNDYILSDPIPTLNDFLMVAAEGLFRFPLLPAFQINVSEESYIQNEYTCIQDGYGGVSETDTGGCIQDEYIKQTSFSKQTSGKRTVDPKWKEVLAYLKMQMPQRTFDMFLGDTDLTSIEEGIAVISTTNAYAKDWIENRLANKIKHALSVGGVRCVVLTE